MLGVQSAAAEHTSSNMVLVLTLFVHVCGTHVFIITSCFLDVLLNCKNTSAARNGIQGDRPPASRKQCMGCLRWHEGAHCTLVLYSLMCLTLEMLLTFMLHLLAD